jgi:cytochrome P450
MTAGAAGPLADDLLDRADITDPALYCDGDPHAVFAHLRRHRPLERRVRPAGRPFWALTRHTDITAVLRDPATFSTEYGLTVGAIREDRVDPAAGKVLEMCEPGRHRMLRQQLSSAYTPRALAGLERRIRRFVGPMIDAAVAKETFDFVTDIADPVASAVIFGLLGIPEQDWPQLCELNVRSETMDPTIGVRPPFKNNADEANHELLRYLLRLVGAGADKLADGHITMLQSCAISGQPLRRDEVILNALGIMHAGHGTLRHAASGGMLALLQHPDEHERVRRDPTMLETLCDEVVRWVTPVLHAARVAVRDVELNGAAIKAGEVVTVWLISANRDEDVFDQPDRFDAGRRPNRHLGYATGPHVCLGANLARLHLQVLLGELLRRMPPLRLTGPVRRVPSNLMGGFTSVPLRLDSG